MKDLWAHNRYLLIVFVLAICCAGFFGVRSVSQFVYWSDPARRDQTLAGWMTPRYVGRSYDIPPEIVVEALGLPPQGVPRRVSLETLSEESGISLSQLQAQIDAAVTRWRAQPAAGRE